MGSAICGMTLGKPVQQLQVLQEEAGVFKNAEDQQHQRDGDRQRGFALPMAFWPR